jgi:hypothetical protein
MAMSCEVSIDSSTPNAKGGAVSIGFKKQQRPMDPGISTCVKISGIALLRHHAKCYSTAVVSGGTMMMRRKMKLNAIWMAAAAICSATTAHAEEEKPQTLKEQITALALPTYDGKTTLGTEGGKIESAMLSVDALRGAAYAIAGVLPTSGNLMLLIDDEVVDLGSASLLHAQMNAIRLTFHRAGVIDAEVRSSGVAADGGASAVAAMTAVTGLLRSETTVTGLALEKIDSRMLATLIATRLGGRAILPNAAIASQDGLWVDDTPCTSSVNTEAARIAAANLCWKGKSLWQALGTLSDLQVKAQRAKENLGTSDDDKAVGARLDAAMTRFTAFFTKATSADDKGAVPLASAMRVQEFLDKRPKVLRVRVNQAGGSFINSKNLATTFGLDPVKVSGGLIASYQLTDPFSGVVEGGGVVICRTTLTSLRKIQSDTWLSSKRVNRTAPESRCKF